ncbi:hypothetical protein B0T24DRAFT_596537 [Lasiosphaeria ovina]|uniref:Uncharacterized protein n=1 Tax=Lasiosphaeria ovina TaxID=92902 RepID=A0AAE0JYZ0_9PEZI|nr:hypothetical protein B0T24DRAFT_596537 [Lasiosphaeria ovina]
MFKSILKRSSDSTRRQVRTRTREPRTTIRFAMPPKGTKRAGATVESSADEAVTTRASRTVRKAVGTGSKPLTTRSLTPAPPLSKAAAPAKTTARRRQLPNARRTARFISSVVEDSATEPAEDDDDEDEDEEEMEEEERDGTATPRIVLVNKQKEGNKKLQLVLKNTDRSMDSASGTPTRSYARRA